MWSDRKYDSHGYMVKGSSKYAPGDYLEPGRFWEPEPNTGCWLWIRGAHPLGYGMTSYRGKVWYAHRLIWSIVNGQIPDGMVVCHKCDTPSCVNPDHIFIGTMKDNSQDMARKNRGPKPIVMTTEKVAEAKRLIESGLSHTKAAKIIGVSRGSVDRVAKGCYE